MRNSDAEPACKPCPLESSQSSHQIATSLATPVLSKNRGDRNGTAAHDQQGQGTRRCRRRRGSLGRRLLRGPAAHPTRERTGTAIEGLLLAYTCAARNRELKASTNCSKMTSLYYFIIVRRQRRPTKRTEQLVESTSTPSGWHGL